jgi:hypothetical protein
MRFVPWYPLSEASAHAPSTPGLFQVRIASGLIDYPTGKSAMIHYGAARDVRRAVIEFAARHPERDWLCRHSAEMTAGEIERPESTLDNLLLQFQRRFGAPPTLPVR